LGIQSVRAKQMKLVAEQIYARHHGVIPEGKSDLRNLSGVGQKITQLEREFIFNKKEDVSFHMHFFDLLIDTNILVFILLIRGFPLTFMSRIGVKKYWTGSHKPLLKAMI